MLRSGYRAPEHPGSQGAKMVFGPQKTGNLGKEGIFNSICVL
jgi:hypothetical protein